MENQYKTQGESKTPEQSEDQQFKIKYQRKQDNETPEQAERRRLNNREYKKQYLHINLAEETPEQAAIRLFKKCEATRKYRERKRAKETPEEATKRRLIDNENKKRRYQTKLAQETAEQAEARRLRKYETSKKYREKKRAKETPEEAEERRLNAREYKRQYYQIKLAQETPEQAEARRLKRYQIKKRYYERKIAKETPEQTATRRLKSNEKRNRKREEQRTKKSQAPTEGQTGKLPTVINEVNSDVSWSSYSGSDGSTSQSTYSTTEFKLLQNYSYASSEQNSQHFIERVKIKSENEESSTRNNLTESDEHLEFVASIVEKLRTCNRSESDIDIAKKCIDEILFNLSAGMYKGVNSDECGTHAIVQSVIVKEEVAAAAKPDNLSIVKNEVNRDEFDECWSSLKVSEGCISHRKYKESTTSEYKIMQNYSDACSELKCQFPLSLFIERDKIEYENDNSLQDNLTESDEHLEYVSSIGEKLRTCNRSKSEIDVAKNLIDEILFDLVHKGVKSDDYIAPAVVQTVIIKEEVDL